MKIGIFGGSFNPVHKGHIEVANLAINNLSLDKLIFVPAFKAP
jgi:nicotinate-nucleotide adenylyltransferase